MHRTTPPVPDDEAEVEPFIRAARALRTSRNAAYAQVKAGTFPLPVIKVGRRLFVSKAALRRLLDGEAG